MDEMGRTYRTDVIDEKRIQYFGWKVEVKRWLGRIRRRWEDDIKMDLRDIGWLVVDWMHLA